MCEFQLTRWILFYQAIPRARFCKQVLGEKNHDPLNKTCTTTDSHFAADLRDMCAEDTDTDTDTDPDTDTQAY